MARKILLADDSVTAQNMGRKILADAGYEVIAVNNGSAALKKFAETKPDLVVLDVYMPGYSGLEVCQRLKESPETARTPVLLTVGKLEPFKPEEAQRVRAEGFIVKPFEASELLSALSKLEDKVVPRPEPSKGGRFARAIAAVEASERGNGDTSAQSGWRSRIGFPDARAAAEDKVGDESDIYNPVSRDLRTVVETPAEKAAHPEQAAPTRSTPEANVGVAALAPAGLPTDVTPEELAAIAAAAAQIHNAEAAAKDEPAASQSASPIAEAQIVPGPFVDQMSPESGLPRSEATESKAPEIQGAQPSFSEVRHAETFATHDEPVTMAAAASAPGDSPAPRWMAVPVALDAGEAAISLEQEMRNAQSALAPVDAPSVSAPNFEIPPASVAAIPVTENEFGEGVSVASIASVDAAEAGRVAADSVAISAETALPDSPARGSQAEEGGFEEMRAIPEAPGSSAEVAQASAMATDAATAASGPSDSETAAAISSQQTSESTPSAIDSSAPEPSVRSFVSFVDPASPAAEREAAVEAQAESVMAEAAAVGSGFTSFVKVGETAQASPNAESASHVSDEPTVDSESVKHAAAAWASWRQIRDTNNDAGSGSQSLDQGASESSTESSPAVAPIPDQIAPENAPAAEHGDSKEVASIVDSVLADLRPKLMEEIARKISQKK